MHIELATASDVQSIWQLHAASWRIVYRGMLSDDFLDNHVDQDREKVWRERFASPKSNQVVLVAKDEDTLLGFVCAYGDEHPQWGTYIDNLHVRPEKKRLGIGRQLMLHIARWSQAQCPASGIYLKVLETNVAARKFYESLGATNLQATLWTPPGGGSVVSLNYVWPRVETMIDHALHR